VFSDQNKKENTFLKTKPNFSLTGKCFLLIGKYFFVDQLSNDIPTQESLENDFLKSSFRERNTALIY